MFYRGSIYVFISNLCNIEYAHGRRTGLEARNTEDGIELQSGSIEAGIVSADTTDDRLKFQPPYFFSEWLDRHAGMATRLTVIVLLPSGITGADVDVNISEEGSELELKFIWPVPFMRPERLCAAFIADPEAQSYNENHPEVIALEKELKSIRTANGLSRSKPIASKTSIPLPFEVQTGRTEKYAFNHFDRQAGSNCHVMHIRLFAKETEYDDTASVGANQVITIET